MSDGLIEIEGWMKIEALRKKADDIGFRFDAGTQTLDNGPEFPLFVIECAVGRYTFSSYDKAYGFVCGWEKVMYSPIGDSYEDQAI